MCVSSGVPFADLVVEEEGSSFGCWVPPPRLSSVKMMRPFQPHSLKEVREVPSTR